MGGANVNANNELLNSGDSNPDYNPINLDAALLWALYNSLAIHMEQVIDSYASLEEPCFLKKLLSKKAVAQYEKIKTRFFFHYKYINCYMPKENTYSLQSMENLKKSLPSISK